MPKFSAHFCEALIRKTMNTNSWPECNACDNLIANQATDTSVLFTFIEAI